MRLQTITLFLVLSLATVATAEGTRTWEQSKFEDLTKGTTNGVAIRSTGGLELAPTFKTLYTAPSTYLWSIASDDAGNVYVAAGSPARVYRITPDGQASTILEPSELQVQALVVDKNGVVFAGTAPDGKVYKIEHRSAGTASSPADRSDKTKEKLDPAWTSSVYFDPKTKYIWDLAFDAAGDLYVATGDRGEIYKVTPKGEHSLFFKSDEVHIRVLAIDNKGNLIAGTDGSGLVYRISPAGEAFVLYSAPKKEITALALDDAGNIYAAGVGEKRTGGATTPPFPQAPAIPTVTPAPAPAQPTPGLVITPGPATVTPFLNFPAPGTGATGGSEVYRIAPDGSPTRLWNSREDIVYALGFDSQGHLLAGTGNRGHIFAIRGDDDFTDLLKAGASQITAFAKAPGGGLYASGSNLGKIFLLGPQPKSEGTYESDIFDAKIFSRWGRAEFRGTGNVELYARSGNVDNPDRNWSPWKKVDLQSGAETNVPAARFVQWKAVLHAGNPAPRVDSVTLNYLSKNVAPQIDDISVQIGTRYQPLPKSAQIDTGPTQPGQVRFEPPVPSLRDRDSIGVKWTAHDDNDDQMVYALYYRGDGESRWLLLKDDLSDKFYSFDASLLPDGGYVFKVVASDAPSHSPGEALSNDKESARVEIDTTAPQIEGLTAAVEADKVHVSFRAVDSFSPIKRAEYSVDANDWQYVEPVGQIADSKTESYDFRAAIPGSASSATKATPGGTDHVVVVRVYDRYDNMSAMKTLIRGK